jgi:hypothetical protein
MLFGRSIGGIGMGTIDVRRRICDEKLRETTESWATERCERIA